MRRSLVVLTAAVLAVAVAVPASAAAAAQPDVEGPITGGTGSPSLVAPNGDVVPGYDFEEYFVSGTATSYEPVGALTANGRWKVEAADEAEFTTRIVVAKPARSGRFNGTVFVEWLNVSAGFDSAPDWGAGHTYMHRAGAAWVGVSAQSVGVQGGQAAVAGLPAGGVKASDPERYAALSHPGDAFSYDIFTQAGRAVASRTGPFAGYRVKRVIAVGESQSAFRLVAYINGVDPLARLYDGFMVHSRGAAAPGIGTVDPNVPQVVRLRPARVPVLTFQTEGDVVGLGSAAARQPDTRRSRLWEVAGTAHADSYTGDLAFTDDDDGRAERVLLDPTNATGGPLNCSQAINSAPAFAVFNAALKALDRWVRTGTPPPKAPRLALAGGKSPTVKRDRAGIALGGIRNPAVDVPLAVLTGEPNEGGSFCRLFGTTEPFDAATLAERYPSRRAYVAAFDRATRRAVRAGHLLRAEAASLRAGARSITFP